MEEFGIVKEVKAGTIIVEIERKSACSRCGLCSLSSETGSMVLELENNTGAAVGDKLKLSLPGKTVLQASFIVFVIPLASFFILLLAGYKISGGSQGISAFAGLAGLAAGFLAAKIIERKIKKSSFLDIKVQKV